MTLNQKNKFNFIVTLLFLSFIAIAISLSLLHNVALKVSDSKIKTEEIKRDIALLDKITQDKNQYTSDIQKVKNTLPSEYYEVSYFTTQLERLAQNNNIRLSIAADKDKKEESEEKFNSVLYSLEITGNYSSVSNYLTQLSKLPYHTSTEKLAIANEEGVLTAKVSFKLFIQ